jgi:hypothetical protein
MHVWDEDQILDIAKTLLTKQVIGISAPVTVQGSSSISVSMLDLGLIITIITTTDDHFFCFGLICK